MTNDLSDDKLETLGRDAVEALLNDDHDGVHVSLYVPARPEALGFRKDPIRLKHVLQDAERELAARDYSPPQIDELLRPARELLGDDDFWRSGGHGVAVLLAPGVRHVHRLPLTVEELAVVADRFHVKPLLPLVGANDRFWVLALSQQYVRLYEASRHTLREIDSLDLPASVEDVVGYDYETRSLQFHTGAESAGGGRRRAMYHGHGAGIDDSKEEVREFFRRVDDGIRKLFKDRSEPLVVAAVDYEIAMYRDVSKYGHVLDAGVEGNPENVSEEELHRAAWDLVRPTLTRARREAASRYEQLAGTGKASRQLEEVVPAAFDGRVATLFVAAEESRWGTYDPETRSLHRDKERNADSDDLLELAAVQSLLQGAELHAVAADEVPGRGPIAAIFRY